MYNFDRRTVEFSRFNLAFNTRETAAMYPVFDRHQSMFCCRHFVDDDREWDELNRAIWVGLVFSISALCSHNGKPVEQAPRAGTTALGFTYTAVRHTINHIAISL